MKERVPLRGGNWNNGSNAGPGALNLNNARSNSNSNIGFRPALVTRQWRSLTGLRECVVQKELRPCLRTNTVQLPAASSGANVAGSVFSMPKTHRHLWPDMISWDNLFAAYREARRGKRYRREVAEFSEHLEENLITLHNELSWGTWRPQPMHHFYVREPKLRPISAPVFRDRVVHHAIVRVVESLFERRFIDHSYACRVGKGTHAAVWRVQKMLRRHPGGHYLQGDITRYFPSVNHDILKRQIARTIGDESVLSVLSLIIDDHGPGLPIGALTSQLLANVYLDRLDHFVTDDLGWGSYTRYMDDFAVVADNRGQLRHLEEDIRAFLRDELALTLSPKTRSRPVRSGVDFCGYRIFTTHLLPRKRNTKRAKRRLLNLAKGAATDRGLEQFRASLMSFLGYMKQCRGARTTQSVLNDITIRRIR